MNDKVLDFQQVSVIYPNGKQALRNVSFSVLQGECLALVGESGSGKSTLAKTALGILPPKTRVSGSILVDGNVINSAKEKILRKIRGLKIGFVAQDPFSAASPLARMRDFVAEAWRIHSLNPPKIVIENSLENFGIENAETRLNEFPHVWSGGMLQRAGIVAASAHSPQIIIADEPTSALDAELNKTVLESLNAGKSAILLISHDINLVKKFADRIAVMKDGEIVEIGATKQIIENPEHQYTQQLLSISKSLEVCETEISNTCETILEAKNIGHFYDSTKLFESINLEIKAGEIIGICGASGCGKSTLLRILATIENPKSGEIFISGENSKTSRNTRNGYIMPIFQDSVASLDRYWKIWRIVTEPLSAKKKRFSKSEKIAIAKEKLKAVGLENINIYARPTELSIGQCQRVAIARALTAEAKIIVADEPTSSLDVVNSHQIMKLFAETAEKGTAIIIVSHDQELLKNYCHRIFTFSEKCLNELRRN